MTSVFPQATTILIPLFLSSLLLSCDAFGFNPYIHNAKISTFSRHSTILNTNNRIRQATFLSMTTEDGEAEESDAAPTDDETSEETEEEEEPKEDPAVTALKEEIVKLERELKSKQATLNRVKDDVDTYTESGYLRKCAEMDNVRRMRAAATSSNVESSRATVLGDFLPVLDDLRSLDQIYADNSFAQKYGALRWDYENALKSFGAADFTLAEGDSFDSLRAVSVGEEYSDTISKGSVVAVTREGVEVSGIVVRPVECVVSLGSEAEAVREAEERAKREAEEKAKAEAAEGEVEQ